MPLFWKKTRTGHGNEDLSQVNVDRGGLAETEEGQSTQPCISMEDQQAAMDQLAENVNDPLETETQFVKTVGAILNTPSAQPYFLQFLESWNADKYFRFCLDAKSFTSAAATRIHCPDKATDSHKTDPSVKDVREGLHLSNIQIDSYGDVSKCESETKANSGVLTAKGTRDKTRLPDLVSNITVTDKVSPETGPHIRPLESELGNCMSVRRNSGSSARDSNKSEATVLNTTNSRAETLRQSIADDARRICAQYFVEGSPMFLSVGETTRQEVVRRIMVENCDIDPHCFQEAQMVVISILEKDFLPKFLTSDFYLKHQIDVLTGGSVRLPDILCNDSAFPFLMEYLEQEGCRHLLEFWVSASNFNQQMVQATPNYSADQAQADAMVLYDKFFSLQATCPLGFGDDVRFHVEGNICREGGPLPTCFHIPLRIVATTLERDHLAGYLVSSLHQTYLAELTSTVRNSAEILGRKKRSGSDSTCSSEQSYSSSTTTTNTLLAVDTSGLRQRCKAVQDPGVDLRINNALINDPDSLWRRKQFSKLSCGFINELGRFESDLQPEPDRKSSSRFSRTLKKFVNMDEDKEKEDLAYKVAQMIIKDVTDITLAPQRNNSASSAPSLSSSSPPATAAAIVSAAGTQQRTFVGAPLKSPSCGSLPDKYEDVFSS